MLGAKPRQQAMGHVIGIVAGALALLTSACGRMADLESPVRETERAPRSSRAPGLPEPATMNRPSSSVPIDGVTYVVSGAASGTRRTGEDDFTAVAYSCPWSSK